MTKKCYLSKLQQEPKYQMLLRESSDKAAQGLLTLLVTINVGAFITVIELLKDHHWLLAVFSTSTITALLARTGIYYIYRNEVTAFQYSDNEQKTDDLIISKKRWWKYTQAMAWISLIAFILGVIALTTFFILDQN